METKPNSGDIWQKIRAQLDRMAQQVEQDFQRNELECQQLFEARAIEWALPPAQTASTETIEVLAFELSGETYAIDVRAIAEVKPLKQFTRLPSLPDFVLGIVNVRGRIQSVIDLRRLFALPQTGLSDVNHLIILQNQEMEFGVLTDRLVGVETISSEHLLTDLSNLNDVQRTYLKGVSTQQWAVLDANRLLSETSLRVNQAS